MERQLTQPIASAIEKYLNDFRAAANQLDIDEPESMIADLTQHIFEALELIEDPRLEDLSSILTDLGSPMDLAADLSRESNSPARTGRMKIVFVGISMLALVLSPILPLAAGVLATAMLVTLRKVPADAELSKAGRRLLYALNFLTLAIVASVALGLISARTEIFATDPVTISTNH